MNEIRDIYNKLYINAYRSFNKDISKKDATIDSCITQFFKQNSTEIAGSSHRAIKVKILKEYQEQKSENREATIEGAIQKTIAKVEVKLMLNQIPSTPIQFIPIKNYQANREAYLKELKTSEKKQDKKLQVYVDNPEVQKIARAIEERLKNVRGLENSNSKSWMTAKDFTRLMLTEFGPSVKNYFTEKGISAGAEDYADIYLAVLLLQKEEDFANGVLALEKHFQDSFDKDPKSATHPFFASLQASVSSLTSGVKFLSQ